MPAAAVGAIAAGAASVAATAITSGFAAVTLATFAVPAAIALGTGLIARAFAPKPPSLAGAGLQSQRAARSVGAISGTTAQNVNSPISAARWIIGQVRCTGRVVWMMVHDDDVFQGRTTVPGGWVSNARYDTGDETTQTVDDVQNIYESTIDNNIGNEPPGTGWKFIDSVENATKKDTVSDLHMALVLSEGPCEGIDEIWLDGEPLTVTKATAGGHSVYTADGFECHEYFKADGTEGAESFAAASAGSSELTWSAATVQGKGLSWVYIKLTQNDYGRDLDSRRYNRIPNIEFVVKGLKIGSRRNPNTGAKTWTENAAIIRKWWLTERRGVNWRDINNGYYNAAVQRCDTTIDISNLDNFDSSAMQSNLKRYTINGLIHSGDDVVRIEEDFDFAWDGSVVEWDGDYLFRPGGDRASVREIVPDDITEEPLYRPGTTLNSNRYLCSLPQSEWHDWLPYDIRVDDIGKQDYDGQVQTLNLGPTAFVSNPAQAANLLRSAARRARASSSIELTLKPGDSFESASIVPGDKVTLSIPELGISDQDYLVVNSRVLAGWAIRVVLAEWGSDWFDDDISLEHYSPRQVIPTSGRRLVAPNPVTVLIAAATDGDGKFTWYALVTAPESLFELYIRYKHADSENWQEWSSFSNQTVVTLNQAGFWDFEVHHRSRDGRVSPATSVRAEATFDVNLPPLPILARKAFAGGFARWVFTNLGSFVNGIEIAYTFEAPGSSSTPGLLNEAGWDAADKLGQYPIVPAKNLTEERTIVQLLPAFGSFNFYARGVDIAGRQTGLVSLGLVEYTLDAPQNVGVDVYGDGTRAYLFTLPNNESVAGCQIRYKKAGDAIPEPGPIENAPPTLIAANSTADGDIILAYSEPLDVDSVPAATAWTVVIDGASNQTPSAVAVDSNTVTLTLTTKIVAGDVVTLDFDNPGSNQLQDTHDEAAADFSGHAVNNTLRGVGHEVDWLSMERLHEGYITAAPYLAKIPGAGIWDIAFRTQAISGHLSDIARVQVSLGEPVQLDIVTAVQQAIADNPALVTLTDEVTRAQEAEAKARAAALDAEAAKTAAETAKKAAELAEAAAEQAETNVNTALEATKTARDEASGYADEAEADALKSADSASAAAGSATGAAGSASTAQQRAAASERSASASAGSATASAASATAAGRSATAAASSASTASTKASEASSEAAAAKTERVKAETAKSDAETAQSAAESAETSAVSAKQDAESAESAAATSESNAASSETAAGRSASAASTSASTAASEASDAEQSATAAETAQTKAETAQGKAETAESNAASSASDADGSATSAASSLSSVRASATAAETAKDDAETAEGNAATSASAASESAKAAKASADDAGTDASAASAARTAAETAQGKAETAESNAATSATNADGSAKAAASSASGVVASVNAAKGSADAAKVSENNAAASATAAASSESNAAASETAAGTSASAAATSATSAATDAATAGTASTDAATSKTAADGSAQAAATSAQAAAASATLAAGAGASATAAATSAQTATAKATEAATSASAAATAQTAAETASAAAKVSETNAAASETTASGAASLATTEKEAAAGFAGDAKQAVAGVTQTASAAVNSALQTTFASIVSMRAVAGEARAKFELVALSDPSGSRAAGVLTGDLQSFDYSAAGGNVPGAFAHGTISGIYVQHGTVGTGGNSSEVEIRKRRDPNRGTPRNAVTATTQSGRRIVYLTDDSGTGENVTFKRADIATAIRGASFINQARPTATGDLRVAIANDGRNIDERVALITLSGGRAAVASVGGTGWRISRNGTAEFDAGVIRGQLKASQIDASTISAGIVDFGTATVRGTLSAAHVDAANLRSWARLSNTNVSSSGSDSTITVNQDLSNFDALQFIVAVHAGNDDHVVGLIDYNRIPTASSYLLGGRLIGMAWWSLHYMLIRRSGQRSLIFRAFGTRQTVRRVYGVKF